MGLCPRMRLGYGNFTSPESPMGYPFHTLSLAPLRFFLAHFARSRIG